MILNKRNLIAVDTHFSWVYVGKSSECIKAHFVTSRHLKTNNLIRMEITVKTAQQLRLTPDEFESIKQKLGRTPNFTELCAFSGMWSEHCSYKNSIKWLKTLPRDGGRMLVAAGEENAGLMDIGNDMVWYLKLKVIITQVRWSLFKARQLE